MTPETYVRPYLDVKEAAAQLGVCEKTIRREIQRGRLRAIQVGRALRIARPAFDAYCRRSTSHNAGL